jgi:hypothetical protein
VKVWPVDGGFVFIASPGSAIEITSFNTLDFTAGFAASIEFSFAAISVASVFP